MRKRLSLKAELWRERTDWSLVPPRPRCDLCGEPLPVDGGADMHEWLVRRGHVPRAMQDCIWDKINCVLLHRVCHREADGRAAHFRDLQIERYGEQAVLDWLNSLPLKVKMAARLTKLEAKAT